MNDKRFLLWILLLATGAGSLRAQVPIPIRPTTPSRRSTLPPNAAPPLTGTPSTARPPATFPRFPTPPQAPLGTPQPTLPKIPLSAVAATNTVEAANISYNFPAVPVDQLLDIYAQLVGRTLLRAGSGAAAIPTTATVTLQTESPLTRSEAIVALETVLGMNGITIVNIGDKFAKVVTEASAPGQGDMITTNKILPIAGKMVTQIVQVKYASLDDLAKVLQPFSRMHDSIVALPSTQTLILRDYAENVDRMLEMVHRIDVLTPLIIKPRVIPIKYALASDIASALSALGASGGTSVGKSTSGANFRSGTSGGNGFVNGTGGAGGSFGQGGIGGAGGYPGQAQTGNSGLSSAATSSRSSFQNNLQKIVQNAANAGQFQLFGQTKIIADERTNSLLVFANDDDMTMIQDIVDKLDVVLAQVLIDAIVMEINLSDTRNTGVSYGGYSGPNSYGVNNLSSSAQGFLTGGTNASGTSTASSASSGAATLANLPGGFSYFGKYGNDLNVVLEAVATDSRINVLSRPRIQTSHAVPADLFIGNTVPYVTSTYSYYGSGPSANYSQLEVGIHLQVLPLINPDGLVVMDIQADVEQIGGYTEIQGVGEVPNTTKRQAGAKVAVRDGETVMLGGFISDSRSTTHSGVPWLMNIPVLGNLFKNTGINNARTELVMLMRPTVLPTPAAAAVVASEERNKLSSVKQAEWEIEREQEDRNARIEEEMAKDARDRAEKARKEALKHRAEEPSTNAPPILDVTPIEQQ